MPGERTEIFLLRLVCAMAFGMNTAAESGYSLTLINENQHIHCFLSANDRL
jgi:hypothetical protein